VVRLRGPLVVSHYHNDPAASARIFRDGWLYPGDLGVLTEQRLLRITGRLEEAIERDRVPVSPLPLEEVLRGLPGVRDVAVFGVDTAGGAPEFCAALILEPGADPATIRAGAAAQLGERAPVRFFVVDSLPRNPNGKVVRRELAALAQRTRDG
jgi:acyl-CoA synthetase (AMP-forming)/AMP-acid ligase II